MSEHNIRVEGPLAQLCEPFDPPHWTAWCACGRFYIGFGEDEVQCWATEHVAERG
jgi:hypothetical protein